MNAAAWMALAPYLAVAIGAVTLMLAGAFRPRHGLMFGLTVVTLVVAALLLSWASAPAARLTPLLVADRYARFFAGLLIASGLGVALLARDYLARRHVHGEGHHREFYLLLLLAVLGAMVLAAARHFAALALGLELLSVALLALLAWNVGRRPSLEAGMKYLVLGGVASALLLFGIALVFTATGSLEFTGLGPPQGLTMPLPAYLWGGLALVIAGLAFKLSLVPLHMWAPDVFDGAPAPVSALLATVSKVGVVAVLLRLLVESDVGQVREVLVPLALLAMASMIAGNLLALLQDNVKRMLAFSSIAHMGYLLVAPLAGGRFGLEAACAYLVGYVVMSLAAFGVVSALSSETPEGELVHISAYRGLARRRPLLALVLAVAMLALAGLPLTLGFVAKFYLFAAGVSGAAWPLVTTLVIGSAIGLFYYLRLFLALFLPTSFEPAPHSLDTSGVVLIVLLLLLVGFGLFPASLAELAQTATLG